MAFRLHDGEIQPAVLFHQMQEIDVVSPVRAVLGVIIERRRIVGPAHDPQDGEPADEKRLGLCLGIIRAAELSEMLEFEPRAEIRLVEIKSALEGVDALPQLRPIGQRVQMEGKIPQLGDDPGKMLVVDVRDDGIDAPLLQRLPHPQRIPEQHGLKGKAFFPGEGRQQPAPKGILHQADLDARKGGKIFVMQPGVPAVRKQHLLVHRVKIFGSAQVVAQTLFRE